MIIRYLDPCLGSQPTKLLLKGALGFLKGSFRGSFEDGFL